MENTTKPAIAIIGTGTIGKIVATNLARSGRAIIIADRNIEKAKLLATELGSAARPMEIPDAIKQADLVILAVWFDSIKEVFYQYKEILAGKIIIDPSNPIAPDGKGGFMKTIGQQESAGELNASLLPKAAKLVKAFGTLSGASLAIAAFQKPEPAVLFYATDDSGSISAVEALIEDAGFAAMNIGNLDQSIRLEVFGGLHEMGALGKTVTMAEARSRMAAMPIV